MLTEAVIFCTSVGYFQVFFLERVDLDLSTVVEQLMFELKIAKNFSQIDRKKIIFSI